MQPLSALHEAAQAYARAGIPVFPCRPNDKEPACEHGFVDATTDLAQIDAWWSTNPAFNPATEPDRSGLCVIDLDPGCTPPDLPDTYAVETPRQGRHLYFKGSLPSKVGKQKPICEGFSLHIDTRGYGGYVLLPPSVVNGRAYRVVNDVDYADCPDWIAERLVRSTERATAPRGRAGNVPLDTEANVARARSELARLISAGDVAIEGSGGDRRTYEVACTILDLGISPELAFDLLSEWNAACIPPWSDEDLRTKIENAARYAQNEAGAFSVSSATEAFGPSIERLNREPATRSRFHLEDEDEQEQGEDPAWLVPGVIPARSTVLMIGPTQSYKSFLALDLCLAISAGVETFGVKPCEQGPTIYAALEGRANIKKARRRAWKLARGIEDKRIEGFYVGPAPIIGMGGEIQEFGDEIKRRLKDQRPHLVIVDTLSKSMAGLNENDASDASRFIRFCDSIVEAFGCSVIAIHHTGKDDARGARGSSAFHAGFDTVLEVKAHRQTKAVEVWVKKHKDAEEREAPFTFEGKKVLGSLVFNPTTLDEHKQLAARDDRFETKKVGAALQRLNAYGDDQAVTTDVLAAELIEPQINETIEDRQAHVRRAARMLAVLAKTKLEGYSKRGKTLMWFLPAPTRT